jgi:hypothetical protein
MKIVCRAGAAWSGGSDAMKTIGLQIAVGLAIMFGSAAASAEPVRTPTKNGADAVQEDISSRHRGYRHSNVRMHKRHLVYSSYPHAPWYSRDYFPRYDHYPRIPINIVYRPAYYAF